MSDIERHRGLLKLGGGEQSLADLQHIFSSVGYAVSLGRDARVDQLWLNTKEPLRIDFSDDPNDFMMADVLDESAVPAIAELEIDEMLGDDATLHQRSVRDRLGLAAGAELDARERDTLRGALGDVLKGMGGVALISGQSLEDLETVRGFYEDTRNIGR